MKDVLNILEQLRATNSSNEKLAILKENKDNLKLQNILKMTYDKVSYNYYITPKTLMLEGRDKFVLQFSLDEILDRFIEALTTREVTGNEARDLISNILANADSEETLRTALMVLNRDLRLNLGRTQINKVWKDLIVKPAYMRCNTYNDKTKKHIEFPAVIELKCDGSFRYFIVANGEVTSISRSGEEYNYSTLATAFSKFPDGVYVGEMLVKGISNRAEANGLLNSLEEDTINELAYVTLWDYVSLEEFSKGEGTTNYNVRFTNLKVILESHAKNSELIKVVEHYVVNSLEEAVEHTVKWMSEGLEGGVLKDWGNVFKNHTSNTQLKLKVAASAEFVITGFTEGEGKRAVTFGAMTFQSADGKIQGRTSGFTDAQLIDYNSRREELIGKIIEIEFNDITKAEGNNFMALSHPRVLEIRLDKDAADTYEKVVGQLESAKLFQAI